MSIGHGGTPINSDDILVRPGRLVLLIGGDVKSLLSVESHSEHEERPTNVLRATFQIAVGWKNLFQGRIRRIQSPHIALFGQDIQTMTTTVAR